MNLKDFSRAPYMLPKTLSFETQTKKQKPSHMQLNIPWKDLNGTKLKSPIYKNTFFFFKEDPSKL